MQGMRHTEQSQLTLSEQVAGWSFLPLRREGCRWDQVLCGKDSFLDSEFGMSRRSPAGDVEQAVRYAGMEFGREIWAKDTEFKHLGLLIYTILILDHITKGRSVDREEERTKDLVLWPHSVERLGRRRGTGRAA